MKKILCTLLAALLLTSAALADTVDYADPERELAFRYDDSAFEIGMDDVGDDEHLVILSAVRADWGEYYIRFHLRDLDDGETFPTLADFAEIEQALGTTATQSDWAGFRNVITYDIDDPEAYEQVFVVPVYDEDDDEVEDILTINVSISKLEDEEAGMARDDAISGVLDTLKILDD